MTATAVPVSTLQIRTAVQAGDSAGHRGLTCIFVDDVDILERERPVRRPDGSLYPYGPMVFYPPDPVGLLPPDSSSLLPSVVPRQAMVGICGCGEPEDASLWMQDRRDRDVVIWEPDPNAPRSSIEATYRFDLVQYLEAVDDGHRSTIVWETRPRLLARELRRQRDSLFGFSGPRLLNVRSWPGVDDLMIEVAGSDGIAWYEVSVPDDQSDAEVTAGMKNFDPSRYQRL